MAQFSSGIVFIDKLQTIYAEFPYPNRDQELAGITREMKQLAMEHQLLLIVSSSLSQNVETRMLHLPYLSDLRESGMIEENANDLTFRGKGLRKPDFLNRSPGSPGSTASP
jgi:replicative DNA helicase